MLCIFMIRLYLCNAIKENGCLTATLKAKDSVAQLVEQYTFNVWVLGSNPSGITSKASNLCLRLFFHTFGKQR